jgi:hypothetical protein
LEVSVKHDKKPADTIEVEFNENGITVAEEDFLARVISIPANTMSKLV